MRYSVLPGLLAMLLTVSCHRGKDRVERTILLKRYQRFEHDTSQYFLHLALLKMYPAQKSCDSGFKHYASLYVARCNGQELYVFDLCHSVDDMAFDTTGRYHPVIDTNDILKRQDSVVVFVPDSFRIPAGARYMVATMGFLDLGFD